MKKTILIIIAIILSLLPCTVSGRVHDKYKEIEPGITTYIDVKNLYIDQMVLDSRSTYCIARDDDNTVVISLKNTSYGEYVENVLVFSPERECIYNESCDINSCINPIKFEENLEDLLSCDVRDIMNKYGRFHTIIGSGDWWYCYITEDGFCIGLNLESGDNNNAIIGYVYNLDLITNKMIEEIGY